MPACSGIAKLLLLKLKSDILTPEPLYVVTGIGWPEAFVLASV
jgi:hypothetical protein